MVWSLPLLFLSPVLEIKPRGIAPAFKCSHLCCSMYHTTNINSTYQKNSSKDLKMIEPYFWGYVAKSQFTLTKKRKTFLSFKFLASVFRYLLLCAHVCISHCFIAVKRYHGNSYKRKHLLEGWLTISGVKPLSPWWAMWWRQSWCWRSDWGFYTQIGRQQEEKATRPALGFWKFQSSPSVTHFYNKTTPPNHFK